jgi:hypothetical protein
VLEVAEVGHDLCYSQSSNIVDYEGVSVLGKWQSVLIGLSLSSMESLENIRPSDMLRIWMYEQCYRWRTKLVLVV